MKARELRTKLLLSSLKRMYSKEVSDPRTDISKLPMKKILVICPHADDEIIGCGAALMHFTKKNVETHVLVVTKESNKSIANNYFYNPEHRIKESYEAKEILGYDKLHYFDFPELGLQEDEGLQQQFVERLEEFINTINPDCVFVPNDQELHPDHRVIGELSKALIKSKKQTGAFPNIKYLLVYEVWGPIEMNSYLPVSRRSREKKELSISCYRSQMASVDYKAIMNFIGDHRRRKINESHIFSNCSKKLLFEGYNLLNEYELLKN